MEKIRISDDGIGLSAVIERPHAQPLPMVICLHGFTGSKESPHNVLASRAIQEAGYASLRVDLYGHGESGGEFRNHNLYRWIDNTLCVLDYARSLPYVTGICLSGHSQGGLVAALVAGMAPDLIKGLILRAPAFMIPQCAREGNLLGRHFDPEHVPDEIRVTGDLTLKGSYLRVAQTVHADEAVCRYKGPVLILHGTEDDVVPPEDSLAAAEKYADCQLVMIPGEGHHFDRSPQLMQDKIRDWLTSRKNG